MQIEIACRCSPVYTMKGFAGLVCAANCPMHGTSPEARAERFAFDMVVSGLDHRAAPLLRAALTGAFRLRDMVRREATGELAQALFGWLDLRGGG